MLHAAVGEADEAAEAFAARTVETHLTKIYEKLGVRARAELAHRLSR
jgi:DNA-binding CsgD family transcriptional regulator